MNKVFFCGKVDAKQLYEKLKVAHHPSVVIAENKKQLIQYKSVFPASKVYHKSYILDEVRDVKETELHDGYDDVLKKILSDSRTFFLAERSHSKYGMKSVFNNVVLIESIVWNVFGVIAENGVDEVVFPATPHSLHAWIFGKVSECMGLTVKFANVTPIGSRVALYKGMETHENIEIDNNEKEGGDQDVKNYVEEKKKDYKSAIPWYEEERRVRFKGKSWSTWQEIKYIADWGFLRAPFGIFESINKRKALASYNELSVSYTKPSKPYGVFFLHYQPERTTLPEGGWFAQQWLALRMLASELKKIDWELVVKEHPSMFYQPWKSRVRDPVFYKKISGLSNASLAPLSHSPFDLIDSSSVVSSVNGTVIYESLIRCKPVIAFGQVVPKNINNLYVVGSKKGVGKAIKLISEGGENIGGECVESYLYGLIRKTFKKEDESNTSTKAMAELLMSK